MLLAKNYKYSTNRLHNELEIVKVEDIAKLDALTFIHNYFNNKLPPVFNNYFTLVKEIHSKNTRRSDTDIYIETFKTKVGISSMKSIGAKNWNELSNSTKLIKSVKTFRRSIVKDHVYFSKKNLGQIFFLQYALHKNIPLMKEKRKMEKKKIRW